MRHPLSDPSWENPTTIDDGAEAPELDVAHPASSMQRPRARIDKKRSFKAITFGFGIVGKF